MKSCLCKGNDKYEVWPCEVLNGSYSCSKSKDCEILAPLAKIRGVTKKRHCHNKEFWALPSNQCVTNHVGPTLIPCQSPNLNIVAVSFFLTPPLHRIFSSIFTKLWQPITLVQNLQNSKTTTFSETSGRALSHGLPCLGHTSGKHWEKCVFVSRVFIKNRAFQQGALYCT